MNVALTISAHLFVLTVVVAVLGWNFYEHISRDGRWALLGAVAVPAVATVTWFVSGAIWWALT